MPPPLFPLSSHRPAPRPSALWLCLDLPQLSLDALGPWPPGVALPALVWQADGARGRLVHQANPAAQLIVAESGEAVRGRYG